MSEDALKNLIPEKVARELLAVPLRVEDGSVIFLVPTGFNGNQIDSLTLATGKWVKLEYADESAVKMKLNELYGTKAGPKSSSSSFRYRVYSKSENIDISDLRKQLDTAPVVKLVDEMISSGIKWGASDIHIEPAAKQVRIRYRLDGKLQESTPIPLEKKQAVISRIKVMAELDIAERRRPQDGRIRVEGEDRIVDMRVSVIPTDFGEKVVIRILDKSQLKLDLESLGMAPPQLEMFKEKLSKPNGIILVTGPTGSGKTTSLYAALNHIKSGETNIITIEDPIEYNLDGINQSQIKPEIGYTFANALRTFLRQDPDIIMVGEIRDHETAEIAVRASLTGHLVLSTLHTNDAASAITRLINMNVEPYLIASSLSMVAAQRLVRLLCPDCKTEYNPSAIELEKLGLKADSKQIFYAPIGCDKCLGTGYLGRSGVYEILPINDEISSLILNNAPLNEYRTLIHTTSYGLLKANAIELLRSGQTSFVEISTL
ncbi:MAG: type II/IV secretion system protein [candidate division Zixibacteria bacterium]|nr:type II/IV secretion system protein [candidate division Zixibacteria bacterium]